MTPKATGKLKDGAQCKVVSSVHAGIEKTGEVYRADAVSAPNCGWNTNGASQEGALPDEALHCDSNNGGFR